MYRPNILNEAEINHLSGDLEKAVELYQKFILNYPISELIFEVKLRIAQCYYGLKKFKHSMENLEEIITYSKNNSIEQEVLGGAYFIKGNIFFEREQLGKAEKTYKNVLVHPEGFYQKEEVLFNLFKCLVMQNKWAQGLGIINELAIKYPSSEGANFFYKYKNLISSQAFFIQMGVFAQKENALKFLVRLKQKGFRMKIDKTKIKGKIYFIVLSGPYDTWFEAKVDAGQLKNMGFDLIIIP